MSAGMKAYIGSDRNGDEGTAMVVFAETAGKAKSYIAKTDTFCEYGYTGIRVNRCPMLDRFYEGKPEMDWLNPKHRVAMVRYAKFECSCEVWHPECEREECPAQRWCGRYESMHDDDDWLAGVE